MSDELTTETPVEASTPAETATDAPLGRVNVFNQQEGHDVQILHPRSQIKDVATSVTSQLAGATNASRTGSSGGYGGG